jgi:methionyl-tRNA formyltransferase
MDAGPIYAQVQTEVSPDETAQELRERLAELGAKLVCETLDMLAGGRAQPVEQDESKVTLAPKLTKTDGLIDFSADAEQIRNLIHGSWPWPGGRAILERTDDKSVQVTIARAAAKTATVGGEPGTLDDSLEVVTGSGALQIRQIKPAGKRLMEWADFVNGYRPRAGDRFIQTEP